MPRKAGVPGRKTRDLEADIQAGALMDMLLVYVPGGRKFRCSYCDVLFDTYGPDYGGYVVLESSLNERAGTACPDCMKKVLHGG